MLQATFHVQGETPEEFTRNLQALREAMAGSGDNVTVINNAGSQDKPAETADKPAPAPRQSRAAKKAAEEEAAKEAADLPGGGDGDGDERSDADLLEEAVQRGSALINKGSSDKLREYLDAQGARRVSDLAGNREGLLAFLAASES